MINFRNKRLYSAALFTLVLLLAISVHAQYFPGKTWETRTPEQVGMNSEIIQQAVQFAIDNQNSGPKDLAAAIWRSFGREPGFDILGPTKHRGETSGMIIKNGYLIAEWGDTRRTDMTFSVAKSYLSTVVALALDDGLIDSVHDPVKNYVMDGKFDSDHNSKITWHHLMQQTSDWEGTLWGTPDWADRPDYKKPSEQWQRRELHDPGSHYKYNDVRVNLLAYCLLQVYRKPLPMVLKEKIMDPIGASQTWRWHGYRNSWVLVDGIKMQSVSGGGHFGGGFFISTRDHARFGYLFLRNGNWNGKQLFSDDWIRQLQVPSSANPLYGYMWWLNTGKRRWKDVPEKTFHASGFGGNYIYVDHGNDLVVVVRWLPKTNDFLKIVLSAIEN